MDHADVGRIIAAMTDRGLKGATEAEVLMSFCEACREAGLRMDRALVLMDTLHPVHEGRVFRWGSDPEFNGEVEYGPSADGDAAETWRRSAFYHLWSRNESEVRRRIGHGDPLDFSMLDRLYEAGMTDVVALAHRFATAGTIGEMDCFFAHFSTRDPDGFREEDLYFLRKMVPTLALAIKCIALGRIVRTVAEVYLGEDAARRVLEGRINRGKADRISAVLWFSDLFDYTRISETAPPEELLPFLNDYSGAVIDAVHEAGGNVLKLVGDGVLAIFKADDRAIGCGAALEAERRLRAKLLALNGERSADARPTTDVYIGLHIGDVFYGNIGSLDRLDFTVIGPAVNEVSRIASMCRSVGRNVLMSSEFAEALPAGERETLACAGRYALRGVQQVQTLFTLESAGLSR